MCGIIGYIGNDVKEVLLDGLEFLEYRGYDSAGIALRNGNSMEVEVYKKAGRVSALREMVAKCGDDALCGIGHTRWATHGGVSDRNCHPHHFGKVTLVHNGIIENYRELADEFHLNGMLSSDTDTEIIAAVLNFYYKNDPIEAIRAVIRKLKGTYACVIMFDDLTETIYSVRNVSPIVASVCEQGTLLASDPAYLSRYTNRYFVLPEYHILQMERQQITVIAPDGSELTPEYEAVQWEVGSAGRGAYPFFMEKEIMEQPQVVRETLVRNTKDGLPFLHTEHITDDFYRSCNQICVIACGTAMHAGMVGQTMMKRYLHMNVSVEMASEFLYGDTTIDEKTLVIAISQSGETIDTLEALKLAKKHGGRCLAILNVRGSAISREADDCLFTEAGPEIAVASTKAYTTQLAVLYLFTIQLAMVRGAVSTQQALTFVKDLKTVPEAIENVLVMREKIHRTAGRVLEASDLFMIGRGLDYVTLMEGSLKLKEVSYIHSEAYAAGELKHGPIALITEGTPVVALMTQEALMSKVFSNIREIHSRGADIVVMTTESNAGQLTTDYRVIILPELPDELMTFPAAVALQLFAYYVSSDKGYDVDKPRNLAKVVTVE